MRSQKRRRVVLISDLERLKLMNIKLKEQNSAQADTIKGDERRLEKVSTEHERVKGAHDFLQTNRETETETDKERNSERESEGVRASQCASEKERERERETLRQRRQT